MSDTDRLEFLISCLNCMDLFAEFVNTWVDGCCTSVQRAESSEWRAKIDRAAMRKERP